MEDPCLRVLLRITIVMVSILQLGQGHMPLDAGDDDERRIARLPVVTH